MTARADAARRPVAGKQETAIAVPARLAAVRLPVWRDVAGKAHGPEEIAGNKATVFVFTSTQCPVANLYSPRLAEMGRDYASKGVGFFLVYSNAEDAPAAIRRHTKERSLRFPAIRDEDAKWASLLGAHITPEAVVLDGSGAVRYRGRIDDNRDRTRVVRHDLRDALDALVTGRAVERPRGLAFGCAIMRAEAASVAAAGAKAAKVTFAHDVAPIVFKNCVSCHRTGESAPFPLETYAQARQWAAAMKYYTGKRLMPPWKAAPGYGDFRDAHLLTDTEVATLARWADSGAPEGDRKATPPLPKFPDPNRWALGTPDLVLKSLRPYNVAADGGDVYRQFVLPLDLPEDIYLSGIEFRPDKRSVVHHMIAYLDPHAESVALDGKEEEPGYTVPGTGIGVKDDVFIAGWAPGKTPQRLPDGTAYRLRKGSKLVLQVHYSKSGKAEADQSAIGLHFARSPVRREMRVWGAMNTRFVLKPGEANQPVRAEMVLPTDATIWSVAPHMHLLGREMKMTAYLPDGTTRPMIWIKDWDFNWQDDYNFNEPIRLPKGTKVVAEAVFDNSDSNPRQPSLPPREVRWGEKTTDEMCIGFFGATVDAENLNITPPRGSVTTAKK
jgi:hypothetical protein